MCTFMHRHVFHSNLVEILTGMIGYSHVINYFGPLFPYNNISADNKLFHIIYRIIILMSRKFAFNNWSTLSVWYEMNLKMNETNTNVLSK